MKNTTSSNTDLGFEIKAVNATTIRDFATEANLLASKYYKAWKNERHFIVQNKSSRFTAVFMTDAATAIDMCHTESGFFAIGTH